MFNESKLNKLHQRVYKIYLDNALSVLFHGWHHIDFVTKKAREFANQIGADDLLVTSAALLHDLNYVISPNSLPEDAKKERELVLREVGYSESEIQRIEKIILEAHTEYRSNQTAISNEGKALSDADTLFKALPITPILLTSKYILENNVDIAALSHKIVSEQNALMDDGIYFYTELAKERYLGWAKTNLDLWNNVAAALNDEDVKTLLKQIENLT